jgi:hypothetical protein
VAGGFLVTGEEYQYHHERCCKLMEFQNTIVLVLLLLEDLEGKVNTQNLLDLLNSHP